MRPLFRYLLLLISLPGFSQIASSTQFGLIKLGSGLSIDAGGVVSASGGGGGSAPTPTSLYGFDRLGFIPLSLTAYPGIAGPLTNFTTGTANTLTAGGSASPSQSGDAEMPVTITYNTGSTSTGSSSNVFAYNASFGVGVVRFGWKRTVELGRAYLVNLPTSAENFVWFAGYSSDRTATPINFVGFRVRFDGTNVVYEAVTRNNSVETATPVTFTATSLFRYLIEVNPAGTSVDFYINSVKVATITTNIPNNTIALHGTQTILKTAGTGQRSFVCLSHFGYYCD